MLSFPRRLTISVSRGLRAQACITAFLSVASESLPIPTPKFPTRNTAADRLGLGVLMGRKVLALLPKVFSFLLQKVPPEAQKFDSALSNNHERGFEVARED